MGALPGVDADAIRRNLASVRTAIAAACQHVGREPGSVRLVAVSKTHPPAAAQVVVDAGTVELAENRVSELLAKQPRVDDAVWHFVGRLQRRKARDLVGRGVLIHGCDRRSLADELSFRAGEAGTIQRVLVQVNVGADPAKAGPSLPDAAELVAYARDLPNLAVEGLMTIPPRPPDGADPNEAARPHFAALRALRDELRTEWPEVTHLSMGMSADLRAAVEEGATLVRVGTAIFGERGRTAWQPLRGGTP